jgi:hypothetical protein
VGPNICTIPTTGEENDHMFTGLEFL